MSDDSFTKYMLLLMTWGYRDVWANAIIVELEALIGCRQSKVEYFNLLNRMPPTRSEFIDAIRCLDQTMHSKHVPYSILRNDWAKLYSRYLTFLNDACEHLAAGTLERSWIIDQLRDDFKPIAEE